MEIENIEPYVKLKSLSKTRWHCRWEAVKSVKGQILCIATALKKMSMYKDAKTAVDAHELLVAICNFYFILGLQILKVIFSNTNALAIYLQNEKFDVGLAKTSADATVKTFAKCRNENDFLLIWERTNAIVDKLQQ